MATDMGYRDPLANEYARVWGEWEGAQQQAARSQTSEQKRYWIGRMVRYEAELAAVYDKINAEFDQPSMTARTVEGTFPLDDLPFD